MEILSLPSGTIINLKLVTVISAPQNKIVEIFFQGQGNPLRITNEEDAQLLRLYAKVTSVSHQTHNEMTLRAAAQELGL